MNKLQLPRDLGDGLLLRWATPADNAQLIELAFHAHDEGDEEMPFVRTFMQDWAAGKFPLLRHEDITVIADTSTGKIVSSMCLFSETWRYGETPFKVGRLEMVMTHADYRRRGLIRTQFEVIHALSAQRSEVMQVITGIPSLYRYFGYQLSLTIGGGYRIYPPSFPKISEAAKDDYRLRKPASEVDRSFIRQLHDANTHAMLFSMDVPDEIWQHEFDSYADGSDGKFDWLLIEDKCGQPLGYVMHQHVLWGPTMNVNFLALTPGHGYLNLLPHLLHGLYEITQRKLSDSSIHHPTDEINGLYLRLGSDHPVYTAIGRDLMLPVKPYAWFVRIPDETTYLNAIKPQLEKHLRDSAVGAEFTGEIKLNFYQRGTTLKFEGGHLSIERWTPSDSFSGDAHFPADSFWSVICGQKSAGQLADEIPDCFMSRTARALLDCLFPPFTGQVWVVGGGA